MDANDWAWWGVPKLCYIFAIYLFLNVVTPCLLDAAQCRLLEKRSPLHAFVVEGWECETRYPWMCFTVDAVFIYPFVLYWLLPEQLSIFALWELVLPWTVAFNLAETAENIVNAVETTKVGHGRWAVVAIHAMNWAAGLSSATMLYTLWARYDFDSMGAHVATFLTAMFADKIFACLLRFHHRIVYTSFTNVAFINDALLNVEHTLVRLTLNIFHELLATATIISACGMAGRLAWCLGYYILRFISSQWDDPFGPTPDWRWTSGLHVGWVATLHLPAIALTMHSLERHGFLGLRALFKNACASMKATWRVKSISRRATTAELRRYDDVCAICLTRLWFGSRLFHLHCQHIFHERCLVKMVSVEQDNAALLHCPTCRQVVLGGNQNRQGGTGDVEQPGAHPEHLNADQQRLRELFDLDPRLLQLILDYRASSAGERANNDGVEEQRTSH